jgi:hypothetical protein
MNISGVRLKGSDSIAAATWRSVREVEWEVMSSVGVVCVGRLICSFVKLISFYTTVMLLVSFSDLYFREESRNFQLIGV